MNGTTSIGPLAPYVLKMLMDLDLLGPRGMFSIIIFFVLFLSPVFVFWGFYGAGKILQTDAQGAMCGRVVHFTFWLLWRDL